MKTASKSMEIKMKMEMGMKIMKTNILKIMNQILKIKKI